MTAGLLAHATAYLGAQLGAAVAAKHEAGVRSHAGDDKAGYSPCGEAVAECLDLWSYTYQARECGALDWCRAEAAFVRIAELLAIYTGAHPPVLDVVGLVV